jgi:hypothetical protein
MHCEWKVGYVLRKPIPITGVPHGYPQLGLTVIAGTDGILEYHHTFSAPDELQHEGVLAESQRRLALFVEYLEYRYGIPIEVQQWTTEKVPVDASMAAKKTGSGGFDMGVALVRSVELPSESMLLDSRPRLLSYLRFANDAKRAPDADAVKGYFMIWEDLHRGKDMATWPLDAVRLKYCRHFVSHGKPLGDPGLVTYLESSLGKGVIQFDPVNDQHRKFVREHRRMGRALIEAEIEQFISKTPIPADL